MIMMVVFLSFINTFIISQLYFWGAVPLILSVLIYLFRYELSGLELITMSIVFGFSESIFLTPKMAIYNIFAYIAAASVSLVVIRLIQGSNYRIKLRGFDAVIISAIFSVTYWLIHVVDFIQILEPKKFFILIALSAAFNFILMTMVDLFSGWTRITKGARS
jgi:hypothetical protein